MVRSACKRNIPQRPWLFFLPANTYQVHERNTLNARSTAPPHRRPSHLTTTHPIPARAPTSDPRCSNGLLLFFLLLFFLALRSHPTPHPIDTVALATATVAAAVALGDAALANATVTFAAAALTLAAANAAQPAAAVAKPPDGIGSCGGDYGSGGGWSV